MNNIFHLSHFDMDYVTSGLTATALTTVYFIIIGIMQGTGELPSDKIIRISAIAIISAITQSTLINKANEMEITYLFIII